MSKDLDIEDLTENLGKKKKINSGRKGKTSERDIVHLLNNRFVHLFAANPGWGQFSRSVGSGNRWGQGVCLPQHAKDTYTGDITTPSNFKFILESKAGYNDVDLFSCWTGKCRELDAFLTQVSDDVTRSNKTATIKKMPMLLWKKDRKCRLAFMKTEDLLEIQLPAVNLTYNDWVGVNFDWILTLEDSFFFKLN